MSDIIRKVSINGNEVMDTSPTTADEDTVLQGRTFLKSDGSMGTGNVITTPVDSQLNPSSQNAIANAAVTNAISEKADASSLATVATSGNYSDLNGNPELAAIATSGSYNDLSDIPDFATVATTGSYNDLNDTPSPVDVQGELSDWLTFSDASTTSQKQFLELNGHRVFTSRGTAGENGYFKICEITVSRTYPDQPFEIKFTRRTDVLLTTLTIKFNAATTTTGAEINRFYSDNVMDCYMHKASAGVFHLYVKKTSASDRIEILELSRGYYMNESNNVHISWLADQVSEVPEGAVQATRATLAVDVTGSATNAMYAGRLVDFMGTRVASANLPTGQGGTGNMIHYLATSAMTEGKPMSDGFILQQNWDNTNGVDSQFFLPNDTLQHPKGVPQFRAQGGGQWGPWISLISENTIGDYAALKETKVLWNGSYDLTTESEITIPDAARYSFIILDMKIGSDANYVRNPLVLPPGIFSTNWSAHYQANSTTARARFQMRNPGGNNLSFRGNTLGTASGSILYTVYGVIR